MRRNTSSLGDKPAGEILSRICEDAGGILSDERMPSRYWRLNGFGGVDLLRADASAHRAAGFADQSHLIRKFKAAYGVTPGQYLGDCNNIQSTATKRGY